MEERRENQRWLCLMPCQCKMQSKGLNGHILDLSLSGARVTNPRELPAIGSLVRVIFRPNFENVTLRGEVIHVMDQYAQFGVKFTESLRQREKKLRAFLP